MPIDKAIDAYQTVCTRMLMTSKQYAEYTGFKLNEVDNLITEAQLISEFLEFINADKQNFALAKAMKLDGPLRDLLVQYRKEIKDSDDKNDILDVLFTEILRLRLQKGEDASDFKATFRPIVKKVIGTKRQDEFIEDVLDATDDISGALEKNSSGEDRPVQNLDDLAKRIGASDSAQDALAKTQEIVTDVVDEASNDDLRKKSPKLIKQALSKLKAADNNESLDTLSEDEKEELFSILAEVEEKVAQLKADLREE